MSDLVGNPEDRFSHNEAHLSLDFAHINIRSVLSRRRSNGKPKEARTETNTAKSAIMPLGLIISV